MATNLQTLIDRIKTAEDGHIITKEYYNSIRAALIEIDGLLGDSTGQEVTWTIPPIFSRNSINSTAVVDWNQANGIASAPTTRSCTGIISVNLPNRSRISKLVVIGRKQGNIDGFEVKLVRQLLAGTSPTTLISIPLEGQNGNFKVEDDISLPSSLNLGASASAAAAEDLRSIDNTKYKYMIIAEADNPTNVAEIHGLQIIYTR